MTLPLPLHNMQRWKPVDAPRTNGVHLRSPQALRAVVAQFDVEHSPRYQPIREVLPNGKTKLTTFCNIFAWDVMRALKVELPHWVDENGTPCEPGKGRELNCNALLPWLEEHGKTYGWSEADEPTAAAHAANGCPAVAIWRNKTGGPGHIAALLPGADTTTRIAQAGARCFFDEPLTSFGVAVKHLRFFIHP